MEAYIEVSFITNILICLLAYYASMYFSLSKRKSIVFFILLLFEQLFHIFLFNESYYVVFYVFEILFYIFLFRINIKRTIMYISIKYFLLFTCFKLFSGSFHLMHYYVRSNTEMLGIWLLLVLCIFLLREKWSAYLKVSDFIYHVQFHTNRDFMVLGFMDSGNQLMYQNIPILFVDCSYKDRFVSLPYTYMEMNSINGIKKRKIYLCCVTIKGYKKQSYYVCCDVPIALEFNCKCLLNLES